MANRDLVAIGTSAGGVEALVGLARSLPRDLSASVLVTIHLPSHSRSALDDVLNRAGQLKASFAAEGEAVKKGRIYIAPPGRHLLVQGERFALGSGPRENNTRPSIDPMLRSAALCCGSRTIGVILTGTLGDGASGLWAVKQAGGITVVQDPGEAQFSEMPRTALKRTDPDHIVKLPDLPKLLQSLVQQPAGEPTTIPDRIKREVEIARRGRSSMEEMDRIGRRSVLTCPDCDGVMWEIDEGDLTRYRCHVGHTYTAELMSVALDENLRRALGSALRALEERRALARKLEQQAERSGQTHLGRSWAHRAAEFQRELNVIRDSVDRIDKIAARHEKRVAAE